jgi:hypothetical protein
VTTATTELRWERHSEATASAPGILTVWSGRCVCSYYVTAERTPLGWYWCWDKVHGAGAGSDEEAESYDVLVADVEAASSCECKGFYRWGACKHLAASKSLKPEDWSVPATEAV